MSALENTLQQVERLAGRLGQEAPAPETLHHAATFIAQAHDAVVAGGPDWAEPAVEVGGDGTVVFLWQDGLHQLSLFVGRDAAGTWVCAPGHSYGQAGNLNVTDNLTRGTATPEEFARDVWPPWSRGETPYAEQIAGFTGNLEQSGHTEEP